MFEGVWLATLFVVIGGLMEGSFALPMRWARHWAWENIWLVYSVVGLLVIPWIAAGLTIPHLLYVYQLIPGRILWITALFGFGWGIANVLFGLALPLVGMAIAFAVIVGMSAALGSLIPLILSNRTSLLHESGLLILIGVALTVLGVILLGSAGKARERHARNNSSSAALPRTNVTLGLILCVVAGFLAPMLNFSFAFGSSISLQASRQGATPTQAANAIWAICLAGGFVSNGGYSAVRLFKNKTWSKLAVSGSLSHYGSGALMGGLWTIGLLLYGWGASGLGSLGAAVGWPVFQATIIVVSSVLGMAAGEWRNAEKSVFRMNNIGLAILVGAIIVLSFGSRM